jgi:Ca2+-binding EF-hand superfamily protein
MLYNVRYEIAVSQMMEQNMGQIETAIVEEFAREDKDDNKVISVRQCEEALKRCKKLNLTPFMVHTLIGMSDCDGDGMVPYRAFARICQEFI